MDYTKLWLDYKPVRKLEGKVFSIINSEKGPIISSILDELDTALTAITGVKPVTFGIDTDYRLRLAYDPDISPEGYKVIKDGGTFSVRSGGHKGLLYGTSGTIWMEASSADIRETASSLKTIAL